MTGPRTADPAAGQHSAEAGAGSPTAAAVAARLAPVVLRIGRQIRPSSGELSAGHFSTLATLHRHGAQRPSDLARIERFAPPAVARVVGALEERGLVLRRPSPNDARSSLVEITEAGVRLLADVRREQASEVQALLTELDHDELALLASALVPLERVVLRHTGDASA